MIGFPQGMATIIVSRQREIREILLCTRYLDEGEAADELRSPLPTIGTPFSSWFWGEILPAKILSELSISIPFQFKITYTHREFSKFLRRFYTAARVWRRLSTTGQTAVKAPDDDDAITTRSLIIERRKWEKRRDKVISFFLCSVFDHVTRTDCHHSAIWVKATHYKRFCLQSDFSLDIR